MEIKKRLENNGKVMRLVIIGRLETTTRTLLHQEVAELDPASYETILLDGRDITSLPEKEMIRTARGSFSCPEVP